MLQPISESDASGRDQQPTTSDNQETAANDISMPPPHQQQHTHKGEYVPAWPLAALIGGLVALIGFGGGSLLLGTPHVLLWWAFFVGDILGGCLFGAVTSLVLRWRQSKSI